MNLIRTIHLSSAAALVAGSFAASTASAQSLFFDLEDQAASAAGLSTLTLSQPELMLDFTKGGETFQIIDLSSASGTVAFDARSLASADDDGGAQPFVINLTPATGLNVSSFSVLAGDFGDDLDSISLSAYSEVGGTGTLLDIDEADLVPIGTEFSQLVLSVEGAGIRSVVLSNSTVAFDNFAAVAVPLPPAVLAAVPGFVIAGIIAMRSRRARNS